MQKWWSLLFAGVLVGGVGLFAVAAFVPGWWLPKNVSTFGGSVDSLFYLILWITGFFFVLTEALLVYFLYAYAAGPDRTENVFGHHYAERKVFWTSFFKRALRPVSAIIHNEHRLELFWTIVPAIILIFIAVVQIRTWENIKYQSQMPQPDEKTQQMEVSARQFEWRVRYPSPERMAAWEKDPKLARSFAGENHTDDLWLVNEVHVWKDNRVLVHLNTKDVIHSFFLPNLRLKQDALPGKTIRVWFQANEANASKEGDQWVYGVLFDKEHQGKPVMDDATGKLEYHKGQVWELNCAELCGWGHYKMTGKLYVHETKADYQAWLRQAYAEQFRTQPSETPKVAAQ